MGGAVGGGHTKWDIDFGFAGIDREGWTYANDFAYLNKHGAGTPEPAWNSYARRRKWKYSEKSCNEVVDGVRARNKERISARQNQAHGQTEKIGYVPRNNVSAMKASGLTSTNRTAKNKEELDEES